MLRGLKVGSISHWACVFLFGGTAVAAADEAGTIRSIGELRALSLEEAARERPVEVEGVVTYFDPEVGLAYVQDEGGGTFVDRPWVDAETGEVVDGSIRRGERVRIWGRSVAGKVAGFIHRSEDSPVRVRLLGPGELPEPVRLGKRPPLDARLHNQWVELEAFVAGVELAGRRPKLELVADGRRFHAWLGGGAESLPEGWVGSDLRMRGIYAAQVDARRNLAGFYLNLPGAEEVEVVDAGLATAFERQALEPDELGQFENATLERARVRGTALGAAGGWLALRTEAGGTLWVEPVAEAEVAAGTRLEAVGFPEVGEGARKVLRDAVLRVGEAGPPAEPVDWSRRSDAELVRLEGSLIAQSGRGRQPVYLIQSPDGPVWARAGESADGGDWPRPAAQSWVAVTGLLRAGDERPELVMRGPDDFLLVESPPWWTWGRVLAVAGIVVALVAAVAAWNFVLRHRVARQAAELGLSLEKQRVADERQRIARELHDSVEQHLAGLQMLAQTALRQARAGSAKLDESLEKLAGLAQHSREEARRSVWDLRAPGAATWTLEAALRELAEREEEGPKVGLEVEPLNRRLPAEVEHHVLRIAQEALANARRHARAERISISLRSTEDVLALEVVDDGRGFSLGEVERVPGHFGLIGMRERATRLGGVVSWETAPGAGTKVRLEVPLKSEVTTR